MPLYEYQCEACGRRFERIQKFSDPPVEVCPTCGGKVNKLVSSPAFQFKGTGWYITDYSRKDKGETSGSSGSASDKGGDSASSRSGDSGQTADAKPAASGKDSASPAKESKATPESAPASSGKTKS